MKVLTVVSTIFMPLTLVSGIYGMNVHLPQFPGSDGEDVFLSDVWPSSEEIRETVAEAVRAEMFTKNYANVFVTKPVDFDHFTGVIKQIDDFFLTVAQLPPSN